MTAVMMIVLSGLCLIPACFPHNYYLVNDKMNWTQAQDYCRENHTDLATVDNEQDVARLTELVTMNSIVSVWIGLQTDTEAWRWSLENQDNYSEGETAFRKWDSGEPNEGPGKYKACVVMLAKGTWADQGCENTFPFFCYNRNTSSIIFVNVTKSWDDAQSYCRENYTDLASVRNQSENEQLMMMVTSYTWIGLYRNSWKWSDGSAYSFSNWAIDKPSTLVTASCGASAAMWVNSDCKKLRPFVCNTAVIKVRKILKVELKKTDAFVDIEQLKEDILEKFSQKLKEYGLSGDIKLSWVELRDGKIFYKNDKQKEEDEKMCSIKQIF